MLPFLGSARLNCWKKELTAEGASILCLNGKPVKWIENIYFYYSIEIQLLPLWSTGSSERERRNVYCVFYMSAVEWDGNWVDEVEQAKTYNPIGVFNYKLYLHQNPTFKSWSSCFIFWLGQWAVTISSNDPIENLKLVLMTFPRKIFCLPKWY